MVGINFFAREQTSPPTVTLSVWVGLVALAASIVLVCYKYRDRVATRWILRGLQVSQLSPYFRTRQTTSGHTSSAGHRLHQPSWMSWSVPTSKRASGLFSCTLIVQALIGP